MADIGRTIGGRYKLVEDLGEDEISTVFHAQDLESKTAVALRVLRPELAADQDFVAEFRLQTRAAARLDHPSITAVYDFGGDEKGVDLITELVEGQTLGALLQRNGPVPPRRAASVTSIVADAVAAAHEQGLVHGGLRASKVLVTRDAEVKVGDFGLARALTECATPPPFDTEQTVYASPEQLRGRRATDASDIYALGALLFELLTGHYPWPGETPQEIAAEREANPLPSPSEVRSGIPSEVEAICRKAMAPDVTRRYQSAAALTDALQQAIEHLDAAPEASAAAAAPFVEEYEPEPEPETPSAPVRPVPPARPLPVAPPPATLPSAPVVRRANPLGQGAYSPDDYAVAPQQVRSSRSVAPLNAPETRYSTSAQAGLGLDAAGRARRINPAEAEPELLPEEERETSMWAWVAVCLALLLVTLLGLTIFLLLNRAPAGDTVYAPDLTDLPLSTAQQQAASLDLKLLVRTFEPNNTTKDDNTISGQDPEAGKPMQRGGTIEVTVRGPQQVKVPNVVALTEADARNALSSAGLSIGTRSDAYDPNVPEGNVVSTNPKAGDIVERGKSVDYVVSMGPEPTPTPTPSPTPEPTPSPTPGESPTASPS